ncbi:Translation elongation factor EF-1 subunit, putative [Penicillium digitatum]|uniref:Elongation factor 1 alpha-like protein n=3 Tax=Penicillium digitatum TaxID=36651 RepID=K9FEZ1_PEND2|nr:Translation elongation factor EF-1 subunit, putative [Penicillium digitatum Pd1]EKV06292.1 Translation elongation factor EF-1 subunit, putative [Penicillium digitatum Pd1]EKV07995.1 Translation elongation factor EF-1 subunit, putative [Penicillium digitatum PHI26]QQK40614.1 Translation elongation factor EF-1 subunit, putative [Penicillium digitatum]
MSRHRIKDVGYDEEDFYDDDDAIADPEEQEFLQQCTTAVLQQLGAGQPSVTATKEEVQDALWHYYNDIEKSVNYLRGKREKEATKLQKSKIHSVPAYPAPPPIAHFSAADFFRDCPWLNIPSHRKSEILIEPLYPRLGLLGGAPESGGKLSKLAALAAARKKKESEKAPLPETSTPSTPKVEQPKSPLLDHPGKSRSLRDRLAASGRSAPKASEGSGSLRRLATPGSSLHPTPNRPESEAKKPSVSEASESMQRVVLEAKEEPEPRQIMSTIRALPSTFASTIVGAATGPTAAEPSHLHSSSSDLLRIYGQDHAEPFDFAAPSPDDVVLNAQNTAKGMKSKSAGSKSAAVKKGQSDLTGGLKDLSVEDKVFVKSKNLDVISEYKKSTRKRSANFVVIGHVDAGKSTLMGRLLADQGAIDQRTLDRYRREAEKIGKGSFALAWVLDQGSEERARGVTIDIATNQFETEKTAFTIVDAPGHRDFVPNMIAGASQADFAVLVIDSSVGKFESGLKGQTKEHALLVRSMGVQKVVVAVNKMDTVQWDHDRFEEIEQQISAFLTTAGFQDSNISFVPCSGVLGDNISRRTDDPHASWYTGRTLIEELETSEPYTHALDKPLRMTIGDVFRGGVQSPLSISGRIDAGSLQIGDQILVMPSGETATVRSLEVDSEPSDWAVAGHNVVLNIANIDPIHLRSGDVVCRSSSPIPTITSFTAKVLAFEHLMPMQVDVHRGRLHVPGRIGKLVASLDKASGAAIKKRPKIVGPGVVARVIVEMDQAVPLEAPTRIVLRAGGSTVAAGLLE